MKTKILFLSLMCISIFSYGQLKESASIDSIFAEWDQPNVPGCALGIMKDGKLIYTKGYGMANLEYDIPNSATSVFRIGSTSKQFTAACIILLVEQEKLSLDKTLKAVFSDFPDYAHKITIRHLLNHTSGIRDYLQVSYLKGLRDDDYYEDEEVMSWLVNQQDLNFEPGNEFLYSNSGYWLLGQIVKEATGMNMAEFSEREIFKPLGMFHTHFHNDHNQIVRNRASGYIPRGKNEFQISMTTLDMIGDGGIFTSIEDIKKWDDAFYNSNVLSPAFWKMMTEQGILNDGEVIKYASGLNISTYKGLKTIRHGGAFVGFRAELLRFPEQHLSIAIFANRGDANPSGRADRVADVMLKDLFVDEVGDSVKGDKPTIEAPAVEFLLKEMTGKYELQPGVIAEITIKKDSLNVLQTWNQSTYNIAKLGGNTFQIPGEKNLSFTFSDLKDGHTQTLTVVQAGRDMTAARVEEVDVSSADLEDYVGDFYSKELDVNYQIKIVDGALNALIEDKRAMVCNSTNVDQYSCEVGLVRFKRTNGIVSGFELDSGRVKNLKFKKSN